MGHVIVTFDDLAPWRVRAFQLIESCHVKRDLRTHTVVDETERIGRTRCRVNVRRVNLCQLNRRRHAIPEDYLIGLLVGSDGMDIRAAL